MLYLCNDVNFEIAHFLQIGFTGIRGKEFSGDIALDNIQITSGPC